MKKNQGKLKEFLEIKRENIENIRKSLREERYLQIDKTLILFRVVVFALNSMDLMGGAK